MNLGDLRYLVAVADHRVDERAVRRHGDARIDDVDRHLPLEESDQGRHRGGGRAAVRVGADHRDADRAGVEVRRVRADHPAVDAAVAALEDLAD